MFKYEKDMIPVLEQEFGKKYERSSIVKEFNSGNGIADLAIAIENDEKPNILIENYAEMYYLTNFFNRKGKRIYPEKLIKKNRLNEKTLDAIINKLVDSDYLIQNSNYFIVARLYKPFMKSVFSIEAKLNKWREGFYQALRYKCFSHKSYLALSSAKIKNVDLALFVSSGVGLISVFQDKIKIIENPPLQEPKNLTIYYHLAEKLKNSSCRLGIC